MKNLNLIVTLFIALLVFFFIHTKLHDVILLSTPGVCVIVVDLDEIKFCTEGKDPKIKNRYEKECSVRDCVGCTYTCEEHGVIFDSYTRLVEAHCNGNFLASPFVNPAGKNRINRR